jgi:hypothetical protein
MNQHGSARRPRDMSRVDTTEEWELQYWASELGLSPQQLGQAVAEVGDTVEALRAWQPTERPNPEEGGPAR